MLCGVGIDLFDASRLERELARGGAHLLGALFTPGELADCLHGRGSVRALALRYAAKEAVAKALALDGAHGMPWRRIEVLGGPRVDAEVRLHGPIAERARELGVRHFRLSFSVLRSEVLATALAET